MVWEDQGPSNDEEERLRIRHCTKLVIQGHGKGEIQGGEMQCVKRTRMRTEMRRSMANTVEIQNLKEVVIQKSGENTKYRKRLE